MQPCIEMGGRCQHTCMTIFYVNVYRIDIIRQREVEKVKSAKLTANNVDLGMHACMHTRTHMYFLDKIAHQIVVAHKICF